ncbi:alpha/beta hydrolase [Nocardioides sp.]|uniref:alpha/beta hydrolase n=1 Tax=Nocardioides sp. TaxID=35761 RepID=UPI0026383AFE|nr:alpha/beta hydrolase [Nocardioides sp.]
MTTDLTALAPRTRLFAAVLRRLTKEVTSAEEMIAARASRARLMDTLPGRFVFGRRARGVSVENITVDGQRFHIHRPATTGDETLPIVLNLHGGGWCQGAPEQSEWLASNVAVQARAVVVSPTYRLAPEHPYPAAVDDAWQALIWVREHVDSLGGDLSRLVVMGDSAGGNLAAVLTLKARESGIAILAQVLIYPAVEMYESYPSEERYADAPVLTAAGMRRFGHLYLGESYGVEDWEASPVRAFSLADLPPALIVSAECDPLRDHSRVYADALRAAEVDVTTHEYAAAIHGFISLPGAVPVARAALDEIVAFLRRVTA